MNWICIEVSSGLHTPMEDRIPSPEVIALQNPAVNTRTLRRIIAENPDWTLSTVQELSEICLNSVVKNFECKQHNSLSMAMSNKKLSCDVVCRPILNVQGSG